MLLLIVVVAVVVMVMVVLLLRLRLIHLVMPLLIPLCLSQWHIFDVAIYID